MAYINPIAALVRRFTHTPPIAHSAFLERQAQFDVWDRYFTNTIYERTSEGGLRDEINGTLGGQAAADLAGLYNPVARVVGLYQSVFDGNFGDEIRIETRNARLTTPIAQIWTWSNLNQAKYLLQELAANLGTVGLRIVARGDSDPDKRRVYVKPEHPRIIHDVELDDRGNVQGIVLQYDRVTGIGEAQKIETIREEQTKETITLYRVDYERLIPLSTEPNDLGVVSYVLLQHEPSGHAFGRNAYYRVRAALDRLNSLLTHIDTQIHDHVNAVWVVAAAGDAPQEFDISGRKIVYINTRTATTQPSIEAMVANLSLSDAITRAEQQIRLIEADLPELKATGGQFLANQSGETVSELRTPAEDALRRARANYEDGLMRAQQIALSWGVLMDLWDVGTGTGTREAADRAYHGGFEDHQFNVRPLLRQPSVDAVAHAARDDTYHQGTCG